LNTRANAEGSLKFIDEAALDPYVFTRESFLQWRNSLASDGKSAAQNDVADLDDELNKDEKSANTSNQTTNVQTPPVPADEKATSDTSKSKPSGKHAKHKKRRRHK